jgi:uncharacterized protein YjbJ (UPF0337 family)
MNWDIIKGNWTQIKGGVREKWGELTEDELDQAAGERDKLVGLIQERYGMAKSEAEEEVDQFVSKLEQVA